MMSHRSAVLLMLLVTLMWSSAGVVTRQLEAARGFEITFWRSSFNALALVVILGLMRGRALLPALRGVAVWASGLCWAVMFTAFMVALSLTTVASVGIAWMFGQQAGAGGSLAGVLVALGVPLAAATNWCLLQKVGQQGGGTDMLPAVLIGACLSAVATLPLAWPLQSGAHDLGLLAFLGVFQLAVPCLLAVRLARELPGHEIALLGQAETLLGVLWAWLFAGEHPGSAALIGGSLVLGALIANEALAPSSVQSVSKNA